MSDEGFLPEWASIKPSTIEGVRYGIFAAETIWRGDDLGFIRYETAGGDVVRSVVGFIGNCDDRNPNTGTIHVPGFHPSWIHLYAVRDIEIGEEIFWRYTLPQYGTPGSRPWDNQPLLGDAE